jgi:hypothetical protein
VKGREARGAAERGHGQDAPLKRSKGRGRGWWLAHKSALEALGEQGRRLTVIRGFYRPCVSADPGFANPGVGVRITECNRGGWAPEDARGTGPRVPCVYRRERPNPEPLWRELWRVRIPGEHRRAFPAWPGSGSSQNGLPGGVKLRSGRAGRLPASPVQVGRGRHVWRACAPRRPD